MVGSCACEQEDAPAEIRSMGETSFHSSGMQLLYSPFSTTVDAHRTYDRVVAIRKVLIENRKRRHVPSA